MEADPHRSPRGDEFAYVSTALGERGDLWTKSADGKRITRLVTAGIVDHRSALFADGRKLLTQTGESGMIVPGGRRARCAGSTGIRETRNRSRLVTRW